MGTAGRWEGSRGYYEATGAAVAIIVLIWGGLSARLYQAACTSARSALLETIDQLARGCLAFAERACVSAVAGATTPCGAVPGLAASAGVASSMLEGCGPKDGTLARGDWRKLDLT